MESAGRKTRCPAKAIQCDSCGTRPTTHCYPCATRHDLCATCCNPLAPSGCGHGPEMGPCCQETLFPMPQTGHAVHFCPLPDMRPQVPRARTCGVPGTPQTTEDYQREIALLRAQLEPL